jgi:hypothetical protein
MRIASSGPRQEAAEHDVDVAVQTAAEIREMLADSSEVDLDALDDPLESDLKDTEWISAAIEQMLDADDDGEDADAEVAERVCEK